MAQASDRGGIARRKTYAKRLTNLPAGHGAKCRHRDCTHLSPTKKGEICTPDGYRMVQMLAVLKTCLESSVLEQRLAALELQSDTSNVEHFRPRVVS